MHSMQSKQRAARISERAEHLLIPAQWCPLCTCSNWTRSWTRRAM